MALAKTLDDKRLQDFSEGADQQLRLSPSLLRLQSAIADVHVPEGRSELDDELSAKLQQLGMQLFSFQEHLAHVIGPKALNVRRHSHSPPESCSSQDLGHILSRYYSQQRFLFGVLHRCVPTSVVIFSLTSASRSLSAQLFVLQRCIPTALSFYSTNQ